MTEKINSKQTFCGRLTRGGKARSLSRQGSVLSRRGRFGGSERRREAVAAADTLVAGAVLAKIAHRLLK